MYWLLDEIIYTLILGGILGFFLLYQSEFKYIETKREDVLTRLNVLRGIFAIEVVIGHVVRYETSLLYPMGKFMIVSVAFFFFVSSAGLVDSYNKKENYLKQFLQEKITYIVILVIFIHIVNFIIDVVVPFSLGYYEKNSSFLVSLLKNTNWYLWELLFFYVLFYFCYKYLYQYRVFLICFITVIMIVIMYYIGWISHWYTSALAFPLGILYAEYSKNINRQICSTKGKITTLLLVVLGLCSLITSKENVIVSVFLRNIMCISAILILITIVNYIKFGNKILHRLGRYSTEIYLSQFVFLKVVNMIEINYKIKILIVLAATILLAIIIHPIIVISKNKCKRMRI